MCSKENNKYCFSSEEEHIEKLHEYNDLKDIAQMVMGQLGMHASLPITLP